MAPALVLLLNAALCSPAAMAMPGEPFWYSADTTVDPFGVEPLADEAIGYDDRMATITPIPLGPLPENTDVTAFHPVASGVSLFALDSTVSLGGSVYFRGDVIRWDGASHSLYFDAAAAGIPAGTIVDALTLATDGDLLLSFDTTVDVGSGVIADDEDVIRYDGGTPSLFFDGSVAGLAAAVDVDGIHDTGDARLALTFDTGGEVAGLVFDDDSVLFYETGTGTWSQPKLGSIWSGIPGFAGADVDAIAVPEPGRGLATVCGLTLLYALARGRRAFPERGALR